MQDVLVKIARHWATIEGTEFRRAYVRRMIVNELVSWRRKWARLIPTDRLPEPEPERDIAGCARWIGTCCGPSWVACRCGSRRCSRCGTSRGWTTAAIADALSCAPATVRSLASRGLQRLRVQVSLPPGLPRSQGGLACALTPICATRSPTAPPWPRPATGSWRRCSSGTGRGACAGAAAAGWPGGECCRAGRCGGGPGRRRCRRARHRGTGAAAEPGDRVARQHGGTRCAGDNGRRDAHDPAGTVRGAAGTHGGDARRRRVVGLEHARRGRRRGGRLPAGRLRRSRSLSRQPPGRDRPLDRRRAHRGVEPGAGRAARCRRPGCCGSTRRTPGPCVAGTGRPLPVSTAVALAGTVHPGRTSAVRLPVTPRYVPDGLRPVR